MWIPPRSGEGEHLQPQALLVHHWGAGSGRPEDSFQTLEAWVQVSWGSPHPGHRRPPWVPLRPIRGSGLGLHPCQDPGIAGSPDGNPAFDRECPQGLFPWKHRAVRPVGPGPLEARGWQPPLVLAFVPFLVLGHSVLHNGVRGCRRLVCRDLLSQRPETRMARMVL